MEVSSQDPSLVAMDLSKGYSVNPLTRSRAEAVDLAKKPEWYHRRPPSCSSEIGSSYRSRASSSYKPLSAQLHPDPGAPVHCRELQQGPESLSNYMNSTLAPALDLYRDRAHGNLWHPGFYGGPDQTGGPVPESSGGEESDSGSDVIFLVSSAKEPLLCSPFIQDGVGHIVEPLSPAVSSLEDGRGCYHLPQPLSSPSPDSSYSEDSSDSSVDIPVHHTRPVVLLSDLSAVYGNPAQSPVDISSDDSDVVEISVTDEKKKSDAFPCKKSALRKKSLARESPLRTRDEKAPPRKVRRSSRIRKSVSEMPQFTCSVSRHSLRRRAKNDAVGIYNESCDSDDVMEYAGRLSSSDAGESASQPNASQRLSSNTEGSAVDRKSPQRESREQQPRRKVSNATNSNRKRKKPVAVRKTKKLRTERKQNRVPERRQRSESANTKTVARLKKKRRTQPGPSARFPPREPEIKLKYANVKEGKKDKKSGSFCPFVHMEKRMCTVVNYQEEQATASSSRGPQQAAAGSLTGFVPHTSCFQLGRFSSESKTQATLLCCLCGQTANAMGLGDLHGPYYPASASADGQDQSCRTEQQEAERARKLIQRHPVNSSDGGGVGFDRSAVKGLLEGDDPPPPKVPLHLGECWIHEDCGIWSAGVFLVRGKLYGLEEAARLAQETTCSACQQGGAIMGCFQKGCPRNYHYRCAVQSGCALTEDNFSIRCPEHKNKLFTSVTRQHRI